MSAAAEPVTCITRARQGILNSHGRVPLFSTMVLLNFVPALVGASHSRSVSMFILPEQDLARENLQHLKLDKEEKKTERHFAWVY